MNLTFETEQEDDGHWITEVPELPSLMGSGATVRQLNHSAVSLRIFGDALDPDEMTALLKCSPTISHRKGDLIMNRDGAPYWNEHTSRYSIRKTGMWNLRAPHTEPADIESQMQSLLAQLPNDLDLWNTLSKDLGLKVEFFCGFFMYRSNEGLVFSESILKEMAERHIGLGLDVYSPSEEDLRLQREAYDPPI
jgi:Domain of unknown function (DUF4279)